MIITTLMAKNVYEQDDHYQSGAKKWSGFGLTNRSGSAGPEYVCHSGVCSFTLQYMYVTVEYIYSPCSTMEYIIHLAVCMITMEYIIHLAVCISSCSILC